MTRREATETARLAREGYQRFLARRGERPRAWNGKPRKPQGASGARGEGKDSPRPTKARPEANQGPRRAEPGGVIWRGGERNRTAGQGISLGGRLASPTDTPSQIQHKP